MCVRHLDRQTEEDAEKKKSERTRKEGERDRDIDHVEDPPAALCPPQQLVIPTLAKLRLRTSPASLFCH